MPGQRRSPSTAGPGTDRGSRWSVLLPAGTFVAGCVLGAVVVAAGTGADEPVPPPAAVSADREDGGPGGTEHESGLYVRVPDSCLDTADSATTLVERVDRVVAAVAELEPERLRQAVDDVQQLRDSMQDVADQCRAAAAERLQDADAAGGATTAPPAS